MKRITLLIAVLVILVGFGGAAAWLQHLHSAPRASEFDCLATAHDGWLTISAGVTVHADWQGGAGRVDGIPGMTTGIDEVKARTLALDLTSPLKARPSGASHSATVHIFAMCDGVPRWWSGTTVNKPSFKECIHLLRPRALLECVREVAEAPAPAPTSSQAYDVAQKALKAAGVAPPPDEPPSGYHFPPPSALFRGDDDSLE